MEKYKYQVKETLSYIREMEIESELPEEKLYKLLDAAERNGDNAEDVADYLYSNGVKITAYPDHDFSSPHDMEVEEWDISRLDRGDEHA